MSRIKRHIWSVASVVALAGLQGPLCALACLEVQAPEAEVAHHAAPPCHETEPAADAAPPVSHDDCGCEISPEDLVALSESPRNAESTHLASGRPLRRALDLHARWRPPVPEATDLPPPDILLLKSTLLI